MAARQGRAATEGWRGGAGGQATLCGGAKAGRAARTRAELARGERRRGLYKEKATGGEIMEGKSGCRWATRGKKR